METLIMHPQTKDQIAALKAIAKMLKIAFETEKNTYDPAFVKKILEGREAVKNGRGVKIPTEDLWK